MPPTLLHDSAIETLARSLAERAAGSPRPWVVGIAGIPGAGKSTLALRLVQAMRDAVGAKRRQAGHPAALVPMDGFHLSNDELHRLGLYERKGAPETFAAERYVDLLRRCRAGERSVRVPVYDRTTHELGKSTEPWHVVTPATQVIVTEGNYLLLDREPWRALAEVMDETWWLDVPVARAKLWIMGRHERVGRSPAEARRKYEADLRNTELVQTASRRPDRVVRWPA